MVSFSRRGSAPAEPRCLLPVSHQDAACRGIPGFSRIGSRSRLLACVSMLLAGIVLQGCTHSNPRSAKPVATTAAQVAVTTGTNAPKSAPPKPGTSALRGRRVSDPLAASQGARGGARNSKAVGSPFRGVGSGRHHPDAAGGHLRAIGTTRGIDERLSRGDPSGAG